MTFWVFQNGTYLSEELFISTDWNVTLEAQCSHNFSAELRYDVDSQFELAELVICGTFLDANLAGIPLFN